MQNKKALNGAVLLLISVGVQKGQAIRKEEQEVARNVHEQARRVYDGLLKLR